MEWAAQEASLEKVDVPVIDARLGKLKEQPGPAHLGRYNLQDSETHRAPSRTAATFPHRLRGDVNPQALSVFSFPGTGWAFSISPYSTIPPEMWGL